MRVAVDVHAALVQAMRTGSIGRAAAQHHRRRAQKPAYAQYDTGTRRPSHRAEAPDEASGDVQALVLDEDVRECVAVFDVQHRVADVRMVSRSTQQTRPDTMIMAHGAESTCRARKCSIGSIGRSDADDEAARERGVRVAAT